MDGFKVACVQMRSSRNLKDNLRVAGEMIEEAAGAGADFILTPENTGLMESDIERLQAVAEQDDGASETVGHFIRLAERVGKWILVGSLAVRLDDGRFANRSFLIAPTGAVAARYDKIHMFDVTVSEREQYRESRNYRPGRTAVLAGLPWGPVGLTICYDLRFPYLYRSLALAGARFLTVPSAFTRPTGQAHWHVLLRARAIETGCFLFAPAQGGSHENGRETYGHSLIIGPWGEILAEAGLDPCILIAKIDPKLVDSARRRIPVLEHTVDIAPAAPVSSPVGN